jgi:hypothetical protein
MSTGEAVLVRGFVFGFGFDFGVAFGRWILIFRRRGESASSSVGGSERGSFPVALTLSDGPAFALVCLP